MAGLSLQDGRGVSDYSCPGQWYGGYGLNILHRAPFICLHRATVSQADGRECVISVVILEGGHTQLCSRLIPGSVLRGHHWWSLGIIELRSAARKAGKHLPAVQLLQPELEYAINSKRARCLVIAASKILPLPPSHDRPACRGALA